MANDLTTKFINLLKKEGVSTDVVRSWNTKQRSLQRSKNSFIEFKNDDFNQYHWKCLIDLKIPNSVHLPASFYKPEPFKEINLLLKDSFGADYFVDNSSKLENSQNLNDWLGFFIPVNEFKNVEYDQIEKNIDTLLLFKQHFNFHDFTKELLKGKKIKLEKGTGDVLNTIWIFWKYYIDFLKKCKKANKAFYLNVDPWYANIFFTENFTEKLPSEQLVILLYLHSESIYWTSLEKQFRVLLKISHPAIIEFFNTHNSFLKSANELEKVVPVNLDEAYSSYMKIVEKDLDCLSVQELLENKSERDFIRHFPEVVKENYGHSKKVPLTERMQRVVGQLNIFERIEKAVSFKKKNLSSFSPPELSTKISHPEKWYELEDINIFIRGIDNLLPTSEKLSLKSIATLHWRNYLLNLGNSITCPFFKWEEDTICFYLQWNTLVNEIGIYSIVNYNRKENLEKNEEARLAKQLKRMALFNMVLLAENYVYEQEDFIFEHLQKKWEIGVVSVLETIKSRLEYRKRKMIEFGIIQNIEERPSHEKHIVLDEILKIEKEVRPYILYVRKAFQASLPIKKTTYFDPYRKGHDGVEFDPETIQDQNRWQRGEVMKILRHKKVFGRVQQVNSFCLDYSGSMRHTRMRSLFKILFLIITGLEDRKVYNSVHFFSSDFIPNSEFSFKFSDRKNLYKILTQICTIDEEGVKFGGYGGTNISTGVENCHQRIKDFTEKLEKRNKQEGIASSLFVISDGEPTMGVTNLKKLAKLIQDKREDGNVSIKGIYIKPEDDDTDFIPAVFGEGNFVESTSFEEGVNSFVSIMTQTFKAQRKEYKLRQRKSRVFGKRVK